MICPPMDCDYLEPAGGNTARVQGYHEIQDLLDCAERRRLEVVVNLFNIIMMFSFTK